MSQHSRLNLRSHRITLHKLNNLGILHSTHVHRDMRLMILVCERLDRLHHEDRLVLRNGIHRLLIFFHRYKFLRVLDTQYVEHLPI